MRTARQRTVRPSNQTQSRQAPLFKASLKEWQAAYKAKQRLRAVLENAGAHPSVSDQKPGD